MEKTNLESDLLLMRPLESTDAKDILRFATAPEIPANTFVPRPYTEDSAIEFLRQAREHWQHDEGYTFALIEKRPARFVGCMGIHPLWKHNRAEVGYWIGKPFWGRGLATEALRLLIEFGFDVLQLNRIEAGHFSHNPASGRVMQKAGMRPEGLRRGYLLHRETYKDALWYAILRDDYLATCAGDHVRKMS